MLRLEEKNPKTFEANSNPYSSPLEFASRQGCLRTQRGPLLKAMDCSRQRTGLQSLLPMPEYHGCSGQGWDTGGGGTKEEHCLAEVALCASELVPLPIREQTVSARLCTHQGANCVGTFVHHPRSSKIQSCLR